ncbi:Bud site selection protein bud4 [Apophysomyces sp. BC1034]|nr:Bud site selection protein bud4 [Apophysomyces sp. BC1021]KAG0192204.1 Bud site selection protein bud4 [Apophysomyces sp. BC1034]
MSTLMTINNNYRETSAAAPKGGMPASDSYSFPTPTSGNSCSRSRELRQRLHRPELGKNFAAKKIEVASLAIRSNQDHSHFSDMDHLHSQLSALANQPAMTQNASVIPDVLRGTALRDGDKHLFDPTRSVLVSMESAAMGRKKGLRKTVTFSDTPCIHEIENFYHSATPESDSQIMDDDEVFAAGEEQDLSWEEDDDDDDDETSEDDDEVQTPMVVAPVGNIVDPSKTTLFATASVGGVSKQMIPADDKQMIAPHPDNAEQKQQQQQVDMASPTQLRLKGERRIVKDNILDILISSPSRMPHDTDEEESYTRNRNIANIFQDQTSLESIENQIAAAIARARKAQIKAAQSTNLSFKNDLLLTKDTNDVMAAGSIQKQEDAEHSADSDETDTSTAASLEDVSPDHVTNDKKNWANQQQPISLGQKNQTAEFGASLVSELGRITGDPTIRYKERPTPKFIFVSNNNATLNENRLKFVPGTAPAWQMLDEENTFTLKSIDDSKKSTITNGVLYLKIIAAENLDFPIDKDPPLVCCVLNDGKTEQASKYQQMDHDVPFYHGCHIDVEPGCEFTLTLRVKDNYTSHGQQWKRLITSRSNGITRYVSRSNGALAQARISFDDIMPQCRGKLCTASFALVNGWYRQTRHILGTKTKRERQLSRVPEKAVGRLTVELFHLPNVDPKTYASLPEDIYTCEQALNIQRFHQTCWQTGYMSQLGGDVNLDQLAQDDDGKERSGPLTKRIPLDEDELSFSVKNSFQIIFDNGEKIEFFCDSAEDRKRWLEVLKVMLGKIPSWPVWMEEDNDNEFNK